MQEIGNRLRAGRGNGATPQLDSETITVLGIPGQKQREKQKQTKALLMEEAAVMPLCLFS